MTHTPLADPDSATPLSQPLLLARLVGSQAAMGAQHGRLTAADAARLFAFYATMPERTLAGDLPGAGRAVVRGIANAWQARLTRERPAELAARSEAFVAAVAAQQRVADPRAARRTFATMDALQNFVALVGRAALGPFGRPFGRPLAARATAAAVPACSTVIAWGDATADGALLFARNFDFPGVGVWDAAPAFVTCVPDAGQPYAFFTTRGADVPAVTVVNQAGLVLAPHTRWHRGVTWGGAMIVDLVHDLARRAETLADVVAIARERPASSSWGIAVGSARERSGLVLELAGRALEVVRPAPGASSLVCANCYHAPALRRGELAASHAWAIHSDRREQRLREALAARTTPLAPRDLAALLGDRRDPCAPAAVRRLGAVVASPVNVHAVVVAPGSQRAWLGVDGAPVCEGRWAELGWAWDGPPGGWELGATAGSGFSAALCPDFVAPHDAATRHLRDAVIAWEGAHDVPASRAALACAIAAAPDDPSLHLAAAWLALEAGDAPAAIAAARAGLAIETDGYRRGQLLLWGARAARQRDPGQARAWRDQLAVLDAPHVDELRARVHQRGRPHTNLLLADAY